MIVWSDRGKWLVVTSSCPFTLQVVERGPWQAVVITCETCLLHSQWSGPLYPDGLCWSSGCIVEAVRMFYAYKCRLTFLEAGQIWGRVICIRMGWSGWYACYVSLWGVWHVFSGGGVPTQMMRLTRKNHHCNLKLELGISISRGDLLIRVHI